MRSISIAVFTSCFYCVTLAGLGAVLALPVNAAGIVASIDKAPVVSNGDVTGQPTDVVITLSGSLDPVVAGRGLAAGDQIRVIFPPQFDLGSLNPDYPLTDVPAPAVPCVPGRLRCSTVVLLKGWPQEPFFPPAAFHTLSIDSANNTLVITALQNMVPTPPVSPGIKQVHLILNGVTNPEPGRYRIAVEAQTGPGGSWETGSGMLHILPKIRPSVNATSVFVKALSAGACGPGTLPPNPDNPLYQKTGISAPAPFTWTLLLWDGTGAPLSDVALVWSNDVHARLVSGGATVGQVFVDTPKGAVGHSLQIDPLGCEIDELPGAPVIGGGTLPDGPQAVGRLDVNFATGNLAGRYTTTWSLNNGNSLQMIVDAVQPW